MNDLERQLSAAATHPQRLDGPPRSNTQSAGDLGRRVEHNLHAIHAELDAGSGSRLARLLRRLGVPDLSIPLITATPALRRSWFVAVAIAVLFALSTASNNQGSGADRIAVFLTLAPLVPLLGVALAFGRGVDPTHDLIVAAPRDTFSVFLIRAMTVLAASSTVLLVSSLLLPEGGLYRIAWLVPAIAITATTMALSARWQAQRVAAAVGISWIVLVLIINGGVSVSAMFGPTAQVASGLVAAVAGLLLITQRQRFDTATTS